MSKVVIFGNSGSGKSTLAKQLAANKKLAHLDLDTIAWLPVNPPQRMPIADSKTLIDEFLNLNQSWVIEGCYSDLLELVFPQTDEVIFLNLPTSACIENAKNRPWEPHKYDSKQAQDENLAMLIGWIAQYDSRSDTFSKVAHERLFEQFLGSKTMLTSNR
ncbi:MULTISPECIES: AAA family ATPase [unclassified Shewanella]|uniref:AAA family ATPase n=1 Tax=unclassified Shewanella TaxID=196818 RepID=UPI00354E16C7